MKKLTQKNTIKSVVIAIVLAMVFTMMPMFNIDAYAASFKAPKNTKLTSAKLTGSREVTLKWKKVKGVTGYKVYKKKWNTNLYYVGTVKGASKLTYVDTDFDKYDYGEIRYLIRTYKTKGGKTKLSDKRFTNRKTVKIKDMAWDPSTEPVNDEIYAAYKMATDISLSAKRDLMLFAINRERAKVGAPEVQMLDILNETAQEKSEEMSRLKKFQHTLPTLGSMSDQLYKSRNFKNFGYWCENIALDNSAGGAMSMFLGSPAHKSNILDKDMTHVGIGFYNSYCTQQFIEYSAIGRNRSSWADAK